LLFLSRATFCESLAESRLESWKIEYSIPFSTQGIMHTQTPNLEKEDLLFISIHFHHKEFLLTMSKIVIHWTHEGGSGGGLEKAA
jgi:hypothetical protein